MKKVIEILGLVVCIIGSLSYVGLIVLWILGDDDSVLSTCIYWMLMVFGSASYVFIFTKFRHRSEEQYSVSEAQKNFAKERLLNVLIEIAEEQAAEYQYCIDGNLDEEYVEE